uniref:Ovule protein n=1 Tax=Ascaris lumbricoides TaxID=6252 RepID=A0A0M3I019_ASCLU
MKVSSVDNTERRHKCVRKTVVCVVENLYVHLQYPGTTKSLSHTSFFRNLGIHLGRLL